MMNRFVSSLLFLVFIACLVPLSQPKAMSENIAVIVNSEAISSSDIQDRMKMLIQSSQLPNTKDLREKIRPQVVRTLIEEQLKIQEAERLGLEVSDEEIEGGFARIAGRNKLSSKQFSELLKARKINPATLHRQIKSEIAWSKVIQKEMRPKIVITDTDVMARKEQIESAIGKTEYLLAEIFLPVDGVRQDNEVRQLMNGFSKQIREGRPFSSIAQQFSEAAGADKGGSLGWVREGQLDPEIDKLLPSLGKMELSKPIKTSSGYHLILMRDKRNFNEESVPSEAQIRQNVGLERLDRIQKRYLMDLKTSAFIEDRV